MKRIPGRHSNRFTVWSQRIALLALAAVPLLCGPFGLSQSSTSARLSGAVTDPSGAMVPNAHVTAQNTGTNLDVEVESDSTGAYAFNSLPPGQYKITAAETGFETLVNTGVSLTVGQNATLNLVLKPGGQQDTVTVSGSAELINSTSAELGQIVDETTVKDLPLNGRDPGQLVFLSAGVTNELNSQASTLQATNSFPNESGASAGGGREAPGICSTAFRIWIPTRCWRCPFPIRMPRRNFA